MSGALEGIYEPGVVDPGYPSTKGTTPFWHSQPHPRANHQSEWPKEVVDVVIIGAGLTGMSLVRNLLKKKPGIRIVLVDARSLCSGATGRNGGHCKTMTFAMWEERKHTFGIEEAVRISAFEHEHLEAMAAAIREDGIDCDLVLTQGIEAYYDQKDFDKAVVGLEDMRAHAPHLAEKHQVHTDQSYLRHVLKLSSRAVGAISIPAASMWPYKWVTGVLGPFIDQGKINVQTHTPVTSIIDRKEDGHATVKTTRGRNSRQECRPRHQRLAWPPTARASTIFLSSQRQCRGVRSNSRWKVTVGSRKRLLALVAIWYQGLRLPYSAQGWARHCWAGQHWPQGSGR
ncbi:hypothetical protein FALCPG4_018119 [Fusarium falciforme]